MTDDARAAPGRRVHWLELFFDLVMVVCIGQIARTMHGEPSALDAAAFFVLLAAAWWAWVNASVTMNLFGARVTPAIWIAVALAMTAIGLMAAAVPQAFGDRGAAFAAGNALIRLIWMLPWFLKRRVIGVAWWRPILYNVVPAALWLASIALPAPARYVLWVVAVAIEVLLLTGIGRRSTGLAARLDLGHAIERVELLVVIVFGESVLSVVGQFADHFSVPAGITAALGFAAIALLAWVFFGHSTEAVERGLRRLQADGGLAGLRDTVMYLPYLLIAGITLFAAGLGTAVGATGQRMPVAAAVCIGGGVSLFFVASTAVTLRYGASWRAVARWGPAGIVAPWLVVPVSLVAPSGATVASAVVLIACLTALSASGSRSVSSAATF